LNSDQNPFSLNVSNKPSRSILRASQIRMKIIRFIITWVRYASNSVLLLISSLLFSTIFLARDNLKLESCSAKTKSGDNFWTLPTFLSVSEYSFSSVPFKMLDFRRCFSKTSKLSM